MELIYAIKTLESHRNKLEDKLDEIAKGEYNHHPEEQLKEFKRRTIQNIKNTTDAIKVLYANSK